jgi:hypothetical protein
VPVINLRGNGSSATNTVYDLVETTPPDMWAYAGVTVSYGPCTVPVVLPAVACDVEPPFGDPSPLLGSRSFAPFRLRSSVQCNPAQWAGDQAEFFSIIRSSFNVATHTALGKAIWDNPDGLVSLPPVATPVPLSVTAALGVLIQQLASTGGGSSGVIHMSPYLAVAASRRNIVYRRGQKLYTVVGDHLVVADGGYSGSGPGGVAATGAVQWMYATGDVFYHVGDLQFASGFDIEDWMQRDANRLVVDVEAYGIFWFDPCSHFAVAVDLLAENDKGVC